VAEQKGDLVDALTGEERSTHDRVPEAVHRRQIAVRHRHRFSPPATPVQHWERRIASVIDRLPLSRPESQTHVPLSQRAPGARAEHVVIVLSKP
jgi:hypothetical protein